MKLRNKLSLNSCNCNLEPLEDVVERNAENIANLKYDFSKLEDELNTENQQNKNELKTVQLLVSDNADQLDQFQQNLNLAFKLIKMEAKYIRNLGVLEIETVEGVLSNTAKIDYIEDGLKVSIFNHLKKLFQETTFFQNFVPYSDETVIFSAERTEGGNFDGLITFDNSNINVGDGMDYQNGRFITPITGVYSFTLSGITGM